MANIQKRNPDNNKPQRSGQKSWNDLSLVEKRELSVAQKKQYLLDKYQKKKFELDDIKKYGVFKLPLNEDGKMKLVCKVDTLEEAQYEIEWRGEFHVMGNTDIAVQNDSRLETFENETQHVDEFGKTIEPTDADLVTEEDMAKGTGILDSLPDRKSKFKGLAHYANMDLNYEGTYIIMPIYEVYDPHISR